MQRLIFRTPRPGCWRQAASLAKAYGADLHLLHVLEPEPTYTAYGFTPDEFPAIHTFQEEARKRAKIKLEEAAAGLPERLLAGEGRAGGRQPVAGAGRLHQGGRGRHVGVGSHGHSVVASLLIGSVAEGVVRKALVPTLVVPAPRKE